MLKRTAPLEDHSAMTAISRSYTTESEARDAGRCRRGRGERALDAVAA
jgi:hypothetical protein